MNKKELSHIQCKYFLVLLKYLPIVVLICTAISTVCITHTLPFGIVLYGFLSPSIFSLGTTILLSKLFHFCFTHRLPIYWMMLVKSTLLILLIPITLFLPMFGEYYVLGTILIILYTMGYIIYKDVNNVTGIDNFLTLNNLKK